MADVIQIAKAKRVALVQEVARLDAWIRTAEQLQREETNTETGNGSGRPRLYAGGLTLDAAPQTERLSNKEQVLRACREFVSEQGTLSLTQLYQGLQSRGINPGTKNPKGMLSIMLSKSEDFISDKKGRGWMLAKN